MLDLQLVEKPRVNTAAFAGKTYTSSAGLGRPGYAHLRLLRVKEGAVGPAPATASGVARVDLETVQVERVSIRVKASASGVLSAEGTGQATVEGKVVSVALRIEHY